MSLISKIEEEFTLLRRFLVSTLGDHIHIHSGVDDALDAVKGLVSEDAANQLVAEGQARGEYTPAEPVTSEGASGGTAEPSAPASEEVPTSTQPTNSGN